MPPEDKQTLKQNFLLIVCIVLFINLIILDIIVLLKKTNEAEQPEQLPVTIKAAKDEEKEDYRLFCQEEISKALAEISPAPQQAASTVNQPASFINQTSITYFTLGGGTSTSNRDWSYVGGAEAYFNKKNYPGLKKISLEVFLRINGAGDANVRLYDATHQVVISNSELWANTEAVSLKSSGPLELLEGENLYQVQLRSTTGYEVTMEGARFKLEY